MLVRRDKTTSEVRNSGSKNNLHCHHYVYSLGTVLFPLPPTEDKWSIFFPSYKHEKEPNSYLLGKIVFFY